MSKGLVHIYCGDGKGKTTAAIGLGIRCVGASKKVLFVQFLKTPTSNERLTLSSIDNFKLYPIPFNVPFVFNMTDSQKKQYKELFNKLFDDVLDEIFSSQYDMLILDEIFGALACNMVDKNKVISFIVSKPDNLEVVMTGRNPDNDFINLADYVSNIKKVKHPFDKNVVARKGIEF